MQRKPESEPLLKKPAEALQLSSAAYLKKFGVRKPKEKVTFEDAYDAAKCGDISTVREWAYTAKDINERHPDTSWNLLHMAAANDRKLIVIFLLSKGADVYAPISPTGSGYTKTLDLACDREVRAIIQSAQIYVDKTGLALDFAIDLNVPEFNPHDDACYKGRKSPTLATLPIKQIDPEEPEKARVIELERMIEQKNKELKLLHEELKDLKSVIEKRASEKKSDLLPLRPGN